jgi:cytochrome c biogenesis protein CcdA
MAFGPLSYGLGFVAGTLSVLSPCVLPLLPIVAGTAASAHPRGVAALAAGLALSFTVVGLFIASIGFAIGLDAEWFSHVAAVILIGLGVLLLSATLQQRFSASTASFGAHADQWLRRMRLEGARGQFAVGALLGLVWTPCVGPTLGAAAVLASQGRELPQIALVMALFGIGAAWPLAVLGTVSRRFAGRARGSLAGVERFGRYALGVLLIALGAIELTGLDRSLEALLVNASPAWLTTLTTRY